MHGDIGGCVAYTGHDKKLLCILCCIEFTDPNGEGMAIMPAPAEESSAAASAYTIGAGESIRIALPLSQYQMQPPLPSGSYCISCTDQASTAAEFTVEVS